MEQTKYLICKDCKQEFPFTVSGQKFFAENNYPAPIRCRECREAKKNKHENFKLK
jgi:hypothetical protein